MPSLRERGWIRATELRRELALKGIARQTIDDVLADRHDRANGDDPDMAAAAALLDRRRTVLEREPDPVKRRQKAYALLARNGFDPEIARQAASSFMIN